jgi:gliding motility-associated-like protein
MFKKILFTYICLSVFTIVTFSQAINITDISTTGHFDPLNPLGGGGCNLGQPIVTATFLGGPGTSVIGGVITCTNPCDTTRVRITLSNVRWSKNPTNNWLHGISITPTNIAIANATLPNGWRAFNSSTGQCPRLLGDPVITTGVGIYFDGTSSQNCCPGATILDNIPDNNYGDPVADCGFDYGFSFDMTFCNNLITNNPFVFKLKGTADYTTGCWTGRDNVGTSQIQFVLSTTPCTVPIFSSNPTATAPVKTCSGNTVNYTSTLTSTCGSGSNVTWWTASTGGTLVGTGSPFVYDPPGSSCPAGTTLYAACCPIGNTCVTRRAFAIPGTCPAALAITAVNKTDPTCATPTGSITGVTVSGNSGALSYTLNPGNITNNTGIFNGLLTGINYTVTVTDASDCSAISAIITFVPAGTGGVPPIVTTNTYTYCQTLTGTGAVPLSATTTSGTGILTWYLPGNPTGIATAPTPSTSAAGTFIYNVTQTIGTCVSAQVPITVTINPTPVAPTPTNTTINYCKDSTAVPLSVTSGTNLQWYVPLVGGGTIVTGVAPTPSTANVGTFIYQVSSTIVTGVTLPNACEGPKATITVNVFAAPAAPLATLAISYCLNATNATALTATAASGNTLLWYTSATGGTGSTIAPIPSTAVATTTSYYVSQVSSTANGSCASPRTKIDVTVSALPASPNVTTPIAYCVGATAAALTAGGTSLLWYANATGGPTGSAIAPIVSTATAGSITYYVSQTVGTCESQRAAIVVNIIAIPAAPTVPAVSPVCQGGPAPVLTATPAPGNILSWYTVQNGGTASATAPLPSTAVVGPTTYYVSQSTPASTTPLVPGCEGPRAAITVTVNAKPAPPTVSLAPVSYCQNNAATALTATPTTGGILLWYTVPTGGTPGNATAPIPSTATVGNSNYYVSQTVSGCESDRSNIVVNISPALTVNAGPDVTIAGGASTQLNGVATAGAGYTWTSNIPPIALSSTSILNPIANPTQTTIYRLTVRDLSGTCLPVFDEVKVEVVQSCINVRNAFTPNGDGINDLWLVYDQNFCLLNGSGVKASVFNRYGSKVFETKDYKNNWDGTYQGKPIPDGTYYAVLEFTLFDGSKQYKKIDVTVLR